MRILLDTHALLWALGEPGRLSASAREHLEESEHELLVSAASVWEIAIKVRDGRLPVPVGFTDDLPRLLVSLRATPLFVSHAHALRAGLLDWAHRDPFDRMLAAQSIVEGAPLVTRDPAFATLPRLTTIW